MVKRILSMFMLLGLLLPVAPAQAQVVPVTCVPYCASWDQSNWVQNQITAVKSAKMVALDLERRIREIQQQKREIEQQIRDRINQKNFNFDDIAWPDLQGEVDGILKDVRYNDALSQQDIDNEDTFTKAYPTAQPSNPNQDPRAWNRKWGDSTHKGIMNIARSIMHAQRGLRSEADVINALHKRAASNKGQLETAETANAIALQGVEQNHKLQNLMLMQMTQQEQFMAQQAAATGFQDQMAADQYNELRGFVSLKNPKDPRYKKTASKSNKVSF